jgi:signal transduction histidine kinase
MALSSEVIQAERDQVETAVADAFVRHSIENRGILTSPRRGPHVAARFVDLLCHYLDGQAGETEITLWASELTEQGLALTTATAMLRALLTAVPAIAVPHLNEFQLLFLEKVAAAREGLQHRLQEQSQAALQRALHHQLEQQIASHEAQKQQNERLNAILQLTTRLSLVADEPTLLSAAAAGLSQALSIPSITLYRYEPEDKQWQPYKAGTAVSSPQDTISLLHQAQAAGGEWFQPYQPPMLEGVIAALILQAGGLLLGGLVADAPHITSQESEPYRLLLRTFAQNLAALWQNLRLFSETRQHAQELEILHGRYLDSLWRSEHTLLQAELRENNLRLLRHTVPEQITWPPSATSLPLKMGDSTFGQIHLPDALTLSPEDTEFIEALVREMGSALSNAQFLQTARAYSNQLSLAADVSRAATTILDREALIQEVVELIRARFNLYYVGLFLLDEEGQTAVLQAGTGTAGAQMVADHHRLAVGGHSMIGTAVATGQPRVEQDVSRAILFTRNPYLPETQSELALPLRARGRTIGALTVQSKETGAFSPESITALQSLADQLGVAIENASLFAQTEHNLAESNLLYETSRRINQATKPNEVYQALVDFAAQSGVVELAQIFVPDPASPDYLISPVFWSKLGIKHNPQHRFSRERFQAINMLDTNQVIRIEDGPHYPGIDEHTRALFTNNGVRAATLVPIYTEQSWLGSLALDRVAPIPLNDLELQPFVTLAAQAAINLANQQLLRQTETLYHIGRLFNQSMTREDALEIAAREIARYVGAVKCRVVMYDHLQKVGFIAAEYGDYDYGDWGTLQLPGSGEYVLAQLQQRAPLLLAEEDGQTPEEVLMQHVRPFGAKASLLIPVANTQEVMGFLAIDSRQGTRPFTTANIIFAQTVMDQLVTQLENLKLLDEALQRAQELITLNQIQTTISYYLKLDELAWAVYQQVGRLLDNTIFTLARYEPQTRLFTPILTIVDGVETAVAPRTLLPDDPLYLFLQQDQHHLENTPNPLLRLQTRPLARQPQSGLWIPMQREGKVNGLISIQSYVPHAYNENDVLLLRSIATQANLAVANSELFARIQAHNEELMQLDQLKTQFLANMSHELRTPLNSIIGFSRVILKGIDGPITADQEEDLTSIYKNGQHLLNLINEILDMAKIEAGKMTLSFEEVDLSTAAQSVYDTVRGLIDPTQVELIWDIHPHLPLIEADPIRIRQILLNLLSNAAKYTPDGHIQLKIMPEDGERVHIVVHDTGIGIAEADFDKIFVAFEQADSSTTRAVGGTGLGLPITKWLVEMHRGEIYFESELNKGSTFHILLPVCLAEPDMIVD